MKTMKQFILFLLFFTLAFNANSVEKIKVKGDSLRIRFENCLLEVATFDLKINTLEKAAIPVKLEKLLSEIEKVEFKTPAADKKIRIKYTDFIGKTGNGFGKLSMIMEENNSKSFVENDGQLLEKDFGNLILEMEDETCFIRLYLEKISDAKWVSSTDFQEKIKAADQLIPENRKKTNAYLVENNSDTFNAYFLEETPPYSLDQLELNAGVLTGWIQNEFVSGFNFRLGLAFSKKGILRTKYFADYEILYDFNNPIGDDKFAINGFLSLGYEKNFSLDPEKANWYGISAGYLVDRGNTFFEKNTFKIAVQKRINNSITVRPEIYFNDFFKNGNPALQIQFTF